MKVKHKLNVIEKIDIMLAVVFIIIALLLIDYIDRNERFGFPINIADEPMLLIMGVILGYMIAKFRFLKLVSKNLR